MGDEPGAIYFEYQYIVHYPDFSALDELYFSLVAHNIHLQADAFAFIYVSGLGEELDVERLALYLPRRLPADRCVDLSTATFRRTGEGSDKTDDILP